MTNEEANDIEPQESMQIIIEIPKEMHKALEQGCFGAKYNMYDLAGCVMNGTPLPNDAEILTKEAYEDLCMRASKGGE